MYVALLFIWVSETDVASVARIFSAEKNRRVVELPRVPGGFWVPFLSKQGLQNG